jgi:hypothetical protein
VTVGARAAEEHVTAGAAFCCSLGCSHARHAFLGDGRSLHARIVVAMPVYDKDCAS